MPRPLTPSPMGRGSLYAFRRMQASRLRTDQAALSEMMRARTPALPEWHYDICTPFGVCRRAACVPTRLRTDRNGRLVEESRGVVFVTAEDGFHQRLADEARTVLNVIAFAILIEHLQFFVVQQETHLVPARYALLTVGSGFCHGSGGLRVRIA